MSARIHHPKPAATDDEPEATPDAAHPAHPAPAQATAPLVYLDMPPSDANIPKPPSGFVPGDSADYRAVLPRDAELRALPKALSDLGKFKNYALVLGETAPPYEQMLRAMTLAYGWSTMRTDTAAWDVFCAAQEGIAWTTLRAMSAGLQPSFELAKSGTSNVGVVYAGLNALLAAKTVIAKKGASTRKANKQATAKGEPPTHGRVGKARKRKAEKAAYAAAQAIVNAPAPSAVVSAAPVAAPAAPVAQAPQASGAPVNGVNGATNGQAHS